MLYGRDFKKRLSDLVTLDLRSLALMRVGLGVLLLLELLILAGNFTAFYGPGSITPPSVLSSLLPPFNPALAFLPALAVAAPWLPAAVFTITFMATLFLIVGWRTRIASAVAFVAFFLLIQLNPLIFGGNEMVLRLMLFIGIFLPWGERFSVDAAMRFHAKLPYRSASPWTAVLLLQISFIYLFASIEKLSGVFWRSGSAVPYILRMDQFSTPLAHALARVPILPEFLSYAIPLFQVSVIVLIFMPYATTYVRTTTMALLMLMHAAFAFNLRIGTFSWVMIAMLASLLPSEFWNWTARFFGRHFGRLTIYYDGPCAFCKKSSYLLKTFLLLPHASVRPAQGNEEVLADMRRHDSWVVEDAGESRTFGFAGMLTVIAHSPILFFLRPLLSSHWVRTVGERCYRFVARNRSRIPLPREFSFSQPGPVWRQASIALAIAYIAVALAYNLAFTFRFTSPTVGRFMRATESIGLAQQWNLFAPTLIPSGWFIAEGIFENGKDVNLLRPAQPASYARPADPSAVYSNEEWRKYFADLQIVPNMAQAWARYECREWNDVRTESQELSEVKLWFVPDVGISGTPQEFIDYSCPPTGS